MKPLFRTLLLNIVVAFGVSLFSVYRQYSIRFPCDTFQLIRCWDYCMQPYFGFMAVRRHKSMVASVRLV